MTTTTEAGRAISAATSGTLRRVATGVNEALHPMLRLIGMTPQEAIASLTEMTEAAAGDDDDARILRESANIAEWYEAQIHKTFTCMADDQFAYGRITRPERLALSSAIGRALDAFRASLQDAAPTLYERFIWDEAPEVADVSEAAAGADAAASQLQLQERWFREAAISDDGSFEACLITPGWGSSGYYAPEVLKRDGPRVFTEGLQMFFDHATAEEKAARPEGSVRNLGATLESAAVWREAGWKGPGLYARAKAVETQRAAIEALAPHVGLSIDAYGLGRPGEADGRTGIIIERLTGAESVDLVTRAGRGGAIRVRESATQQETRTMADNTFDAQLSTESLRTMQESIRLLQEQNTRLAREAQVASGRDLIRGAIARAELPELARARLAESLQPILTAEGALDREQTLASVETAIEREAAYLAQITGRGRVAGLGGSGAALTVESAKARLTKALTTIGLSERAAQIAADGR